MNSIREIQRLNRQEIEAGVSIEGSWHNDYRDTAYIYIGGLPFNLTEGDIITIFSQFGEPTYLNLQRDKETGKSRGFAFLKYEDQRSTDLAVDNMGGATIMGRILKVDHTRYKRKDGEEEEERERMMMGSETVKNVADDTEEEDEPQQRRPLLKEEVELQKLLQDHDEDDPMKEYLVMEKREEVAKALEAASGIETKSQHKHRHQHRHHHRSSKHRHESDKEHSERRRHRHRSRDRRRSRSR